MWDLIVSVPDHCLSFYFSSICFEDIEEKHIFTSIKGQDSVIYKRI